VYNEFFAIGTFSGSQFSGTYSIKPGQGPWSQRASLNVARTGLCSASEGTKIYAHGGLVGSNTYLDTTEIYEADPAQTSTYNTWRDVTTSVKASFSPVKMTYCAAVSSGTKILIFAGQSQTSYTTGTIRSFDILTEKWDTPIASPTISARNFPSATFLNGLAIVSGGTVDGSTPLAKVEAFDLFAKKVFSLPDLPSPRLGNGYVADGDSIIVVGGQSGNLIAPVEKLRVPVV